METELGQRSPSALALMPTRWSAEALEVHDLYTLERGVVTGEVGQGGQEPRNSRPRRQARRHLRWWTVVETARAGRRPQVPIAVGVAMLCLLGVLSVLTSSGSAAATAASLRFGGATQFGLDRLLIPVDNPPTSADIGATDFTIEFWMKGTEADNSGGSVGCNTSGFLWINGRIIVDRDRLASGGRDFGISVTTSGRVTFGVENASGSSYTICSSTSIDVLDNAWHHVAVQRRRSDGRLRVFVDGSLEATAAGPNGDVSYPEMARWVPHRTRTS